MTEKSVLCFVVCISILLSLDPITANEENQDQAVLQQKAVECCDILKNCKELKREEFSIRVDNEETPGIIRNKEGPSCVTSTSEITGAEENLQERSTDVIMTTLTFTQGIHINETQVIEVWSQNISSQTRKLFHRLYVRYPDGAVFSSESTHIEIHPSMSLWTRFTVSNMGKGIGLFDFSCEVWEEVNPSTKKKHDEKNNHYWAKFYRPSGVSANYYCDDTWHHPSDSRIYEMALLIAGGTTSPRDAAIALADFVYGYVTHDAYDKVRTSDIMVLVERKGDCNDFADLYIGLARSINIPTRIVIGSVFYYNGGDLNHLCGAYCIPIRNMGHAWAESYYNGAFHHIDPSWNEIEYPGCYINSNPDIHAVHAFAYTACSDNYSDDCSWAGDAECCLNGFVNVTTTTDGGYDTKYFCPSDTDNDGVCDSLDPDRDGDGTPNSNDPDPCTGTALGFVNIPSLFPDNNIHVVGDTAYCTDVLGTANVSWIFGWNSIQRPEGRTDTILTDTEHQTGNLLITGGPAVNLIAHEYNQYFNILYTHNPGTTFQITCEGHSISLNLVEYPSKDIAVCYLGTHNGRAALLTWGYGWRGTYAATVLMSHPDILTVYGDEHLLFVEWVDFNYDGLITWNEIHVVHPYHVSVSSPPTGSSSLISPIFWNMRQLFGGNSYHVVGNTAYCTDVLGTANVSWAFGREHPQYYMQRPEGRTDTILTNTEHQTGNLLITGGPAVNSTAHEYNQYFNITYTHNPGTTFQITCEGHSISLNLAEYPYKDICIVYVGQQNNQTTLLIWGYGWRGTYAGTLVMANAAVWNIYSGHHLLLLEWTDWNSDGLVQYSEVLVTYP
jgi:hypothetical protein